MCRLRIANPPSHIQAAQGSLVAAPLARVPATVAAGKSQYMTDVRRVTNAHRRQQPQPHTSRTLEAVLTAPNTRDRVNVRTGDESPPGARTGTLTGIAMGGRSGTQRRERRARPPFSTPTAPSVYAHHLPSTPTASHPHTQAPPRIPWTTRAAHTDTQEPPRRSQLHNTRHPR